MAEPEVDLHGVFDRLSPSSRHALAVADAFRISRRRDAVHMEHLLVGLYEKADGPTMRAFEQAGILPDRLRRMLHDAELDEPDIGERAVAKSLRSGVTATADTLRLPQAKALSGLPPLSAHAQRALHAAAMHPATSPPTGAIQSRNLLYGAFSIKDCKVIKTFEVVRPHIPVPVTSMPTTGSPIGRATPPTEATVIRPRPTRAAEQQVLRGAGVDYPERPPAAATEPVDTRAGTGAANDRAEGVDQLHFTHYVQAFTDLIESPETQPPLVIGIFGSWGAGKSFLLTGLTKSLARRRQELARSPLRRARRRLEAWFSPAANRRESRRPAYVYSVAFNAWEYNAAKTIWPRLVRRVLDTVGDEVRWRTRPLLWLQKIFRTLRRNFFRKLRTEWSSLAAWLVVGSLLAWLAIGVIPDNFDRMLKRVFGVDTDAATFSIVAGVGALVAVIKLLHESFFAPFGGWVTAVLNNEAGYGREDDAMRAIRDDLDLLDRQLRAEKSRVLIVVDDLDRCEPEKAIEVLQAINLMLDRDSFIIALGIDARVITAAVEKHYKELLGPAGITGYEYLDKIVQIPFRIPEPTPRDLADFLASQLGHPGAAAGATGSATPAAADARPVAARRDDAAAKPQPVAPAPLPRKSRAPR